MSRGTDWERLYPRFVSRWESAVVKRCGEDGERDGFVGQYRSCVGFEISRQAHVVMGKQLSESEVQVQGLGGGRLEQV